MSISFKFFACIAAILLAISSFVYYYYPKKHEEYSLRMLENKVNSMAEMIALGIGVGRDLNDFSVINNAFNWVRRDNSLAYIILIDEKNKNYATFNPRELSLPTQEQWNSDKVIRQSGLIIF